MIYIYIYIYIYISISDRLIPILLVDCLSWKKTEGEEAKGESTCVSSVIKFDYVICSFCQVINHECLSFVEKKNEMSTEM